MFRSAMPTSDGVSGRVTGMKVFLVEDEFLILMQLESMLQELGCEIGGTASHLGDALSRAETCDVDLALLDINLGGKKIYPVAEVLQRRKVPIVFSTGYGQAGIDPPWTSYPVVQKPFMARDLERALAQAREMRAA
jgi:DNA-binding LytR/AlgR family response regulator